MRLFDYLDFTFQTTVKAQRERPADKYSVALEGKTKAAHAIILFMRVFFKYLYIPLLLGDYLLVQVGLKRAPVPQLPTPVPTMNPGPDEKAMKAAHNSATIN